MALRSVHIGSRAAALALVSALLASASAAESPRPSAPDRMYTAALSKGLQADAGAALGAGGSQHRSRRSVRSLLASRVQPAPSWFNDSAIYEVNIRQYTPEGTFKAFATHLPRLKALGVEVLWLMPIHPIGVEKRLGTLGSYYSVRDYRAVNPEFGSAADFKALMKQAHALGFKVILDWVANHTAWDNPWLSANPNWYTKNATGDIISPAGTGWSDVADLNYDSAAMRAAMISAMRMWVKDYGVDGFRCDVAGMVPSDFWDDAITTLRKVKPVLMLAENQSNTDLLTSGFNVNYNWALLQELRNVGLGWVDSSRITDLVALQREQYPAGTMPMNFITNHDENSWNGTEFEELGRAVAGATVLYFTLPGVPLVYTGQEAGMDKRLKFFDKDEVPWRASSMATLISKLVSVKKRNSALWNGASGGSFSALATNNSEVFAYVRTLKTNKVVVVVNPTDHDNTVTMNYGSAAGKYIKLTDGVRVTLPARQTMSLKPWSYEVFSTK
ncbi:MAG: alpha-amylase [Actinobacteria bacterium]|nr:alpha-amylase [Actinomycetota bacterium]